MTTIELVITETGRNSQKDKPTQFFTVRESFQSAKELKDYLKDRYAKLPNGKKKIYRDRKDGTSEAVGFLHSFWNKDWSHNSPKWYQTDWIEFFEQETQRSYFPLL